MREVRLGPADVTVDPRPDGTLYVRQRCELHPYPAKLTERLDHWAAVAPDRTYMAQRDETGDWRRISYAETRDRARRIAAALIKRNLSPERPVAILSGADLEHQVLGLGAMYAGVPHAPVSPPYSLISTDFGKLKYVLGKLTPGLIFVDDGEKFARAIAAAVPDDVEIVVARNPLSSRPCTLFESLLEEVDEDAVDAAHAAVGPDTIAKILFTSGSTGNPKGVITTQRMLCSNQQQLLEHFLYFGDMPPVLLDWSPWHHVAGGNHDVGICLYNGGTFYIDDGAPTPAGIAATVRNLKEVSPTWFYNIPRGYDAMMPFLREDAALRRSFFKDLRILYYAAAAMPQHTWDELDAMATETCGEPIVMLTGLGSTETAPFAMVGNIGMSGAGVVGLPAVGLMVKLVPAEGKLEARMKGPNITPGYWREPELTAAAYDEEGFYKLGDAVKFVDPAEPSKGFMFDGRVTEDFKLTTGTWVSVGPLRLKLIEQFAPYLRDVVITAEGKDFLGALVIPDVEACRMLAPDLAPGASPAEVLAHKGVREAFAHRLATHHAASTGSSTRIERVILMAEPPSIDAGEITDKGSINQRAVLRSRPDIAAEIYAEPPTGRTIVA